jgi:hypothetical protein
MKPLRMFTAAAVLVAFAATAFAQANSTQPAAPASAAGDARMGMHGGMAAGMGGGMGAGMGGGMGPRARADNTPGWSMMTPQEREQHRKDMQSAKTADECKAMMDKHRQQMADRAKERGLPAPKNARHDMCASMR